MTAYEQHRMLSMPFSPSRDVRKWFLQGAPVAFELWGPKGLYRKLCLSIPDRLVGLYMSSLSNKIFTDGVTQVKKIRITLGNLRTVDDIELPALNLLLRWIKLQTQKHHGWHLLPPTSKVEDYVLLLRACQLLCVEEGRKSMAHCLERSINSQPLTPDGIKMLWYMFGASKTNIENIARNLAHHDGLDTDYNIKDDFVYGFLRDEVPFRYVEVILQRATRYRKNYDRDTEDRRPRQRRQRSPIKTVRRLLDTVERFV